MANHFNYARAQKTADRLISKFGPVAGAVFLKPGTKTSGADFDPVQASPTSISVKAVVLDYAKKEVDGQRVQATDKKVYVSAVGLTETPNLEWQLQVNGVTYQLIAVNPLQPGDTLVLLEVQCRRS